MLIRALSGGERGLAREVFGAAIGLESVRILASPFPRAFVPGRWFGRDWIIWPQARLPGDMMSAPLPTQATFIHELVHVWQAQQGVNLLFAKLKAGDRRESYVYPVSDDCRWDALNIEQQACAVEHAFRLSRGGTAPAREAFYRSLLPLPACGLGAATEPRRI